jgi:two-component system cell cycle response regulator
MDVVEQIIDRLSIFNNLYDSIRVVDPISKKVIGFDKNKDCNLDGTCFDFWNREDYCTNCISMRAYNYKDTYIKLEYKDERVFLVIASLITIDHKQYIVELLKDITSNNTILKNGELVSNLEKFINEINSKAVLDKVSGVFSKNYLMERLPIELKESIEKNQSLSAIALDIDLFSQVNQSYGYKAGDKLLSELGKLLMDNVDRENSWISRYGGDKFLILVRNLAFQDCCSLGESIRKIIETGNFVWEKNVIKVTASMAIIELGNSVIGINQLLHIIKDSMHEAKSQGRNKTIVKDKASLLLQ